MGNAGTSCSTDPPCGNCGKSQDEKTLFAGPAKQQNPGFNIDTVLPKATAKEVEEPGKIPTPRAAEKHDGPEQQPDQSNAPRTNGRSRDEEASDCASDATQQTMALKYDDGAIYVGQTIGNKRHGDGRWKSAGGTYNGQWVDDQFDGEGQQLWDDGRHFDGQFSRGHFHGYGKMEWPTKDGVMVYEGQYVDGQKHGTGKFKWPDGKMYDGQWITGMRSGEAVLSGKSGEKRRGRWADDKFLGWIEDREIGQGV